MMKKTFLLAAIMTALTAACVPAAVFEHDGFIIAGDGENTYVCDTKQAEGEQTEKIFYYPPEGNFCVWEDKLYFVAGEDQLVRYDFESGETERLGSVGGGFFVNTFFAGVLDGWLFFTVADGYSEDRYSLKYVDLETGEIRDFLTDVYYACVWDGQLFAAMALPDPENPEEKQICFGPLSQDYSQISDYSLQGVATVPKDAGAPMLLADSDALYFQDYAVDEATGEKTGVCLKSVCRKAEGDSYQIRQFGQVDNPDAVMEFLGEAGGQLFIRIRYPDNEAENSLVVMNPSDGSIYDIYLSGKKMNQSDGELYFTEDSVYYMAEDASFWQLSFDASEDQLIAQFPFGTEIQGVTGTDVYFLCGGDLYSASFDELEVEPAGSTTPDTDGAQSSEALLQEIVDGLQKTVNDRKPVPWIWPAFLQNNPQVEEWLQGTAAENLQAVLSLDTGIEIAVEKEDRSLTLRARYEEREEAYTLTIPEKLYTAGKLYAAGLSEETVIGMEELLAGRPVTCEEGSMDDVWGNLYASQMSGQSQEDIPCRIYHVTLSWEKVEELVQETMAVLSSVMEELPLPAGSEELPDVSGQIAQIRTLTGDGIFLDFYITESGCVKIEAAVLKSPQVTGVSGSKPQLKRIAEDSYTPGMKWSLQLMEKQRIPMAEGVIMPQTDITVSAVSEVSDGSYPDRNYASYIFRQYRTDQNGEELTDQCIFPFSYWFGTSGMLVSCRYRPADNQLRLSSARLNDPNAFDLTVAAPEVPGNDLLISFEADGTNPVTGEELQFKGTLTLSK